jgi:hypothetical protein
MITIQPFTNTLFIGKKRILNPPWGLLYFWDHLAFSKNRVPSLVIAKRQGHKKSCYQDFAKMDLFFLLKQKKNKIWVINKLTLSMKKK